MHQHCFQGRMNHNFCMISNPEPNVYINVHEVLLLYLRLRIMINGYTQ